MERISRAICSLRVAKSAMVSRSVACRETMREERRSRELFTVFADLSEQVFECVDHGTGLRHEAGQRFQIVFFKFQRLGIAPMGLGGMPVLGKFAGVLDEIHGPVKRWTISSRC